MAEIRGELTEYPETGGRLKEDEWPPEKLEPGHGHRYNTVLWCHLDLSTDLREVSHCTVNITNGRLKGSLITKPPIGL